MDLIRREDRIIIISIVFFTEVVKALNSFLVIIKLNEGKHRFFMCLYSHPIKLLAQLFVCRIGFSLYVHVIDDTVVTHVI